MKAYLRGFGQGSNPDLPTPHRVVASIAGDESPAYLLKTFRDRIFLRWASRSGVHIFRYFRDEDLFHEVGRDGVDFGWVVGVDPGVVFKVAAGGILGDVAQLVLVVFGVADAVLMEARLPDAAWKFLRKSMGEAAFDALGATFDGLIYGGSQEDVDMFRHDCETVQVVAALVAVAQEGVKDQAGIESGLEQGSALRSNSGNAVGVAWGVHGGLRKS